MLGHAYRRYRGLFPCGIRQPDRLMHLYIVGQTGTGKSTLLGNLIRQDAEASRGYCIIDPHGDLARSLTASLSGDPLIWNVADPESPYGYNPLTRASERHRPLIASGLIETLKKQWIDAWGARMEHLLRYAVLALLEQPQTDLREIVRLFIDKEFRARVVARVTDEQVLAFWREEYPNMNYQNAVDGVAPIANKLGAFLAHPVVRKAVCEPEEPLRFRRLMDDETGIIVNLGKGQLGADLANVLGGLVITSIMNAAFTRHELPEAERRPFFLYVDEFHNFTTGAVAGMMSESRKYGLGLTLAHQHIVQTEQETFEAILGNTGSIVSFRVGPQDAPTLSRQLTGIAEHDLISVPNHHACAQVMVDGERTKPFSLKTMP